MGPSDRALFARWRDAGDPAARAAIVERYLPLAQRLVSHYRAGNERDDLEQVAAIGLIKAVDRYDPDRGIAFTALAVPTILGELKRYFRDHGWAVRVPRHVQELAQRCRAATDELTAQLGRTPTAAEVAARCATSAEKVIEARAAMHAHFAVPLNRPWLHDDDDGDRHAAALLCEEPGFARVDAAHDFACLLDRLPPREQRVLRLRFQAGLTQREIAAYCGISQMQVSRLIAACLRDLADQANTDRGSVKPTFQTPASTISRILRSPATLQST